MGFKYRLVIAVLILIILNLLALVFDGKSLSSSRSSGLRGTRNSGTTVQAEHHSLIATE